MMGLIRSILFTLLLIGISISLKSQQSVFSEGKWVKMKFDKAGIYKLDFNTLNQMGFEAASIDPRQLAVYGIKGGMLSQKNSEQSPTDLIENRILIQGEDDGNFSPEDYLLFYVDSPDAVLYDQSNDIYKVEKNLYTDSIFYFLTVKPEPGLRINSSPNLGSSIAPIKWYRKIIHHENEVYNLLNSGRQWFGERFTTEQQQVFAFENLNFERDQDIKISASAITQSFITSSLSFDLDGRRVETLDFQPIPNTQYGIKANEQSNTFTLSTSELNNNDSDLEVAVSFNKNGQNSAIAYLDYLALDIPTKLTLTNEAIHLRNPEMLNNTISNFEIENTTSPIHIWNITNTEEIISQEYAQENGTTSFGSITDQLLEFIIFETDQANLITEFESLENQNLKQSLNHELLIVTHPNFKSEAERLASFRMENDQVPSKVVTTSQIYNEFSGGRQDVSAIRNFIRYNYDNGALKYVLLFGKGSYDYKNRVENNSNFVPTYESRNSIHPLLSYSSDDYFGFLDKDEGEWLENRNGDHQLDIGIGRLPVNTIDEARIVVDKLIRYQSDPRSFGNWRKKLLFIADDGDRNIHQRDADILATLVDTTYSQFKVEKLYLDQFEQIQFPNGEKSKEAEDRLKDYVNSGALIINYTGHGAEFGWMQERILTFDLMEEWNNPFKLPFLITATCEFGRNDDPEILSGAEFLLLKEAGGAIGLVTTARPVFSSTNFRLNEALYASVLEQQNGKYQRLGDIIKFTKNNSLQGSLNRNFILLGDPSMTLTYPEYDVEFTEINGNPITQNDTIRAFDRVRLNGNISNEGRIQNTFNGTGTVTVFDKKVDKETLGDESDPFNYQLSEVELYRGDVHITNGTFEFEFFVPKNINYAFDEAKISFYAQNASQTIDASGALTSLILGGTSDPVLDREGPQIDLYINDTTKAISGEYDNQVELFIQLEDETGINISNLGLGQDIKLIINDSTELILNEQLAYQNGSYQSGNISVSLNNLIPGINRFYLEAWDNVGNPSAIEQEFSVKENTNYLIEINNHPNPFLNETLFFVEHLLEDENIELEIDIHDSNGAKILTLYREYLSANSTLRVPWEGVNALGQKVENGIYIYTTKIRSKTSGKSAIQRKKLIISN